MGSSTVMDKINSEIINPIITGLFALAVLYFLFGLTEFIRNQDNEEAQSAGKQHMIWGVIGIAIMLSVEGILGLIEGTLTSLF